MFCYFSFKATVFQLAYLLLNWAFSYCLNLFSASSTKIKVIQLHIAFFIHFFLSYKHKKTFAAKTESCIILCRMNWSYLCRSVCWPTFSPPVLHRSDVLQSICQQVQHWSIILWWEAGICQSRFSLQTSQSKQSLLTLTRAITKGMPINK